MTSNLELGEYGTPMNLTNELSNVGPSGYTLEFAYANNSVYKGNSNKYGNYYNWSQATAGSGDNITTAGENAPYSICPKNWRLPSAFATGVYNDEFYIMLNNYITTGTWQTNHWEGASPSQYTNTPVSLVFSGWIYDNGALDAQGTHGLWWSATFGGSPNVSNLRVDVCGSVIPDNYSNQSYGFTVRCLVDPSQ